MIIKGPKYVGIIFGRDEQDGSETYFCTFNKKGELISKIQLAFYMHAGSYTKDEEGRRASWYAEKTGCINKDVSIITDVGLGNPLKYRISDSGKIREVK